MDRVKKTMHRFSDVAEEPCILLSPIKGYNEKPLVTLEEAVEPLIEIVPDIRTQVHIVKQRAATRSNDLTLDESAAIQLYTTEWQPNTDSLYYILNKTLRSEQRQRLKPWFLYLKLILTALSRIQSQSIIAYRGVNLEIENEQKKYKVGKETVWWGFSSCSADRNISEQNHFLGETGLRTLFIINCINGKDIGKYSYDQKEKEILLLPATTVKVTAYRREPNGLHIITLEEIPSSIIFLEPVSPEEIENLKKTSNTYMKPKLQPPIALLSESERAFNSKLQSYIACCKPGAEIFLSGSRLTENDIEVITKQLITDKHCRQLHLRESGITSNGASIISDGLRQNASLQLLFIPQNQIGDIGVTALAQALKNNNNLTLQQLCLGYNGITDKGVEELALMLESNKTLTHLWLPSNKITARGLQRLAEVLRNSNRTLQELSLEWNNFENTNNVDTLVDAIKNNQSFLRLNLCSCKLSKSLTKQLQSAAKSRKKFELSIN